MTGKTFFQFKLVDSTGSYYHTPLRFSIGEARTSFSEVEKALSMLIGRKARAGWISRTYSDDTPDWLFNRGKKGNPKNLLSGKEYYVINHTKKQYVDYNRYRELASSSPEYSVVYNGETYFIHPFPVLVSSGRYPEGRDDYGMHPLRGYWFKDEIEATTSRNRIPADYRDVTEYALMPVRSGNLEELFTSILLRARENGDEDLAEDFISFNRDHAVLGKFINGLFNQRKTVKDNVLRRSAMRVVTQKSKLEANVSRDGRSFYVEIYNRIGEVEKDGRKLPLFYDEGKKDSMVSKFNKNEWAVMIRGIEAFLRGGAEQFEKFAVSITGNEKMKNLLFPHNDKIVGLKTFKGKEGDFISFYFYDRQADKTYQLAVKDRMTIIGMVESMKGMLQASNLMEYVPTLSADRKEEIKEDSEVDVDVESVPDL